MKSRRNEIMKLTEAAKSWDYTCTFCFRKFPSAQAMGGHQNSHRKERREEKQFLVKDPLGYRKRVYVDTMDPDDTIEVAPNPRLNVHEAANMVKKQTANFNAARRAPRPPLKKPAETGESSGTFDYVLGLPASSNEENGLLLNLFPLHGHSVDDVKGEKKCVGEYGVNFELDLTLRL